MTDQPGARESGKPTRESPSIPRPAGAPPDHASLPDVEQWLRYRRTESAYGFDPATGKKVWERHTDGMEVALSAEDRARLRGMIFTHNHPRGWAYPADDPRRAGSSFSPHDVHTAALAQFAELRAVAPAYDFTMRPGPAGWPVPDVIEPMVNMVADRRDRELAQAGIPGILDRTTSSADDLHAIWTELAPVMGLEYHRERRTQ